MASHNNFQVNRNKNKNAVGLYDKGANFNKSNEKLTKSEKLMKGINLWAGFYRARPDIFVRDYLGIELKPFQSVLLCIMIYNNYTMFWGSRGLGKSFLTALYCVVRCILFPGKILPVHYRNIMIRTEENRKNSNIVGEYREGYKSNSLCNA